MPRVLTFLGKLFADHLHFHERCLVLLSFDSTVGCRIGEGGGGGLHDLIHMLTILITLIYSLRNDVFHTTLYLVHFIMFMNIEFMFVSCILHLHGMNIATVQTAELQNIFQYLLSL